MTNRTASEPGRRFSDAELRELADLIRDELPKVLNFANGTKKRSIWWATLIGTIATLLGLAQVYLIGPVAEQGRENRDALVEIQKNVQSHHEEAAKDYVLRTQYERDQERVIAEIRSLRELLIYAEQQRKR